MSLFWELYVCMSGAQGMFGCPAIWLFIFCETQRRGNLIYCFFLGKLGGVGPMYCTYNFYFAYTIPLPPSVEST